MRPSHVLLALAATTLCAQSPIEYSYQSIYSGQGGHRFQPTVREECRSIVIDSGGSVYTVGIRSNGTDLLNATRQFVSLGRWQADHWTALARVNERDGYVYSPAVAADSNRGLWIAWSEFNEIEQEFDVYARHWDQGNSKVRLDRFCDEWTGPHSSG